MFDCSSTRVSELLAERERVDAELMQTVGAWAASGEWSADGSCTPTSWLVHHGRTTAVEAARLVRNGRFVHRHERTAKLLDAGDVTASHIDTLARAARNREPCVDEHEETLLDAARVLPVEQFRSVARRWRHIADDVLANRDATAMFDARYLHASVTFEGRVKLDGLLDPESGETVLAALDAHMEPDPSTPAAQRRADALVALAQGKGREVSVDVLIDSDTLTGEMPIAGLTRARSDPARVGSVAPETIRRLACDATIGRIVWRGESEVLDVGRRSRVVTPRAATRPRRARRRVRLSRLYPTDALVRRPPPRPLGRRRTHRPRQPRPPLPQPSHPLPRRRLDTPTRRTWHHRRHPAVRTT